MPKSRGRHPSKRKPTRTQGQTPTLEGQSIKLAAQLLEGDASRVRAELIASEVLGNLVAAVDDGPARDRRTEAIGRLLVAADRRRTPAAAALLAAVQLLVQRPDVQEALDAWAAELIADLAWPTQSTPLPTGARTIPDPYDDHVIWLLDYDDCIIAAATARWFHQGVLNASVLLPGPIGDLDAEAVPVDLETAVRAVTDGQQHTEMYWPPHDDEDYVATAAMLSARLRAIELPEVPDVEWQPITDEETEALIAEFFASLEGGPFEDDEVTRELADLCLSYGDGYIDGDRLAWSPEIVETFLLDWVPRKTMLDEVRREQLPIVTYEWVVWALTRRGLSRELAVEAAEVALEVTEDFLEAYDDDERSVAVELAAYLEAAGIDLADKDAVAQGVSLFNAERNARLLLDR